MEKTRADGLPSPAEIVCAILTIIIGISDGGSDGGHNVARQPLRLIYMPPASFHWIVNAYQTATVVLTAFPVF